MTQKAILTLIAAALTFQMIVPSAMEAADSQPGAYVWYVQRTATQTGSARRDDRTVGPIVQTRGPIYTYQEALAVKKHLDQNRSYGTIVYSVARIVRVANPAFKSQLPVQPKRQQSQFSRARRR